MAEPATLKENIAEYEKMQALLETEHWGEHVVFYDREFRGAFKEFHQAMRFAYTRWGRGPYLIREVGEPPLMVPFWFPVLTQREVDDLYGELNPVESSGADGPASLTENIRAYEEMQDSLESDHWGEHVVFYDREFRGAFKEFHQAMRFAWKEWGRGPYLIREVKEQSTMIRLLLPARPWRTDDDVKD